MNELVTLQSEIDALDDELVVLLRRRFERSRQIGTLKRAAGRPPYDSVRIAAQIRRFVATCADAGLDPAMARQLLSTVIAQVVAERLGGSAGAVSPRVGV